MRVVVVGATGNVGTSVVDALLSEPAALEVHAIARRMPARLDSRITFHTADIASSELVALLRGADAVIHLAWLIQPGRDEAVTYGVNVTGTARLLQAAVEAGVPAIVYASSIGTYSPGPKDRLVDESWPTDGIATSFYSRHKSAVERMLDRLEREQPQMRIARMRPALIFKREAATEVRRLFAGPLFPQALLQPRFIPFVPDVPRLRFQAVHSLDVGDAFKRATLSDVHGAFNLAADPPIGPSELAELLSARRLRFPASVLRAAAAAAYALRLTPTEPGWLDMGLGVPLIDSGRAHRELGWTPSHSSLETLSELLDGLRAGSERDTPPLARSTSGPARVRELLTGVGGRA